MAYGKKHILKAACMAIALLGSTAIVTTIAAPDAAYAKGNGNGGGNGNSGGNGGGNGNGKGSQADSKAGKNSTKSTARTTKSKKPLISAAAATKPKGKPVALTVTEEVPVEDVSLTESLRPNQKGKWNAANANQAALDAHIRNQNFNGTIGALAQYQLAAKAAAGETLSEDELAALEGFIGDASAEIDDAALAGYLNDGAVEGDPVYGVVDGVVSCTENCDGVDVTDAQAAADAEAERLQEEAQQAALDSFLDASETRIVDESNKALSPEDTETLLDELAATLGVVRAPVVEVIPEEVTEEETDTSVEGAVLVTTGG
jgi:hypothetical protein